ncbi:hypothetical protein [Altericista sp. CCNU0014]|uniref:right-handed parallel beta-helix repeat-containing protein n=1 Tax=Altericista sp. CCNU0014 TaxID=3082949 RepID=UPI00384C7FFE
MISILFAPFSSAKSINIVLINISSTAFLAKYFDNLKKEINVDYFGALGNGLADDTEAIKKAFNHASKHGFKIISFSKEKVYRITESITLYSNLTVEGRNSTLSLDIKFVSKNSKFYPIFSIDSKSNIAIKNIVFECNSSIAYGVVVSSSSNIKISSCKAKGASLFYSGSKSNLGYSEISSSNMSSNILVQECEGIGNNDFKGDGCIFFSYTNIFSAIKNNISGYTHGIVWWGGDSNHLRDGSLSNPRKCIAGHISQNYIHSIKGGGIWGSMGHKIDVLFNNVLNCGDVGIDSEGSFSVLIRKNLIKNCANGCIATFFFNKDIYITENRVYSEVASQYLFKINNSAQSFDNKNIAIKNNLFVFLGKKGLANFGGDNFERILVHSNKFINTSISLSSNNNRYLKLTNNLIEYTQLPQSKLEYIVIGNTNSNGSLYFLKNKLRCISHNSSKIFAIRIIQSDFNSASQNFIRDNLISGFSNILYFLNSSQNLGIIPKFYVENNIFSIVDNQKQQNCNNKKIQPLTECNLYLKKDKKIFLEWRNNKLDNGEIISV